MTTTHDPQKFAEQVLNDIEVTTAEAWQAVEDWDADRLRRAMADLAAHVAGWQRGPVSREITARCVYGKCDGASCTSERYSDLEAWMDEHVATHPHNGKWATTFQITYASNPGMPSVAYREPVMIDE